MENYNVGTVEKNEHCFLTLAMSQSKRWGLEKYNFSGAIAPPRKRENKKFKIKAKQKKNSQHE